MIYQLTVSTLQEYNHSQNNPFTLCITSIFLPVNDLHVPLHLSQTSLPNPSMIYLPKCITNTTSPPFNDPPTSSQSSRSSSLSSFSRSTALSLAASYRASSISSRSSVVICSSRSFNSTESKDCHLTLLSDY